MTHGCHATGCSTSVPPKMFLCRSHWFTLPLALRRRIWATYRPGQEDDKQPSKAYCEVARECVVYLAKKDGVEPDTRLYDMYLRSASA